MSAGMSACMSVNLPRNERWSLQRGPFRIDKESYCFCTGKIGNTRKTIYLFDRIKFAKMKLANKSGTMNNMVWGQTLQAIQKQTMDFRNENLRLPGTSVQGFNLYTIKGWASWACFVFSSPGTRKRQESKKKKRGKSQVITSKKHTK